jgi:hypothetical protein
MGAPAVTLALVLGWSVIASPTALASPLRTGLVCDGTWRVVAAERQHHQSSLRGVTAVSPSLAWAVGNTYGSVTDRFRTVIERWDGSAWSIVPSPNVGATSFLLGVAAPDATHAFAVGGRGPTSGMHNRTLAEQFDGTSWSVVSTPSAGPGSSYLSGVSALAAEDAWAVGGRTRSSGHPEALAEHWDGVAWSIVLTPRIPHALNTGLSGVSAVSANDVWAVGGFFKGRRNRPLAEHWNGTAWSIVPVPAPGPEFGLQSVDALGDDDVWAVGGSGVGPFRPLAEHWDGSSWSIVKVGHPGSNGLLYGVASSDTTVYAVGRNDGRPAFVERFEDTSFQPMETPRGGRHAIDGLSGAASDGSTAWGVGGRAGNHGTQPLVEYLC